MVLYALHIFGVVVLGLCMAEKLDLPVTTCKRDAANYSSCLKRACREAWPLFVKGLPAEFDFPPLYPYFYEYEHETFDSGELHAEVTVSNATIKGYEMIRFMNVRPHFLNEIFRLEINIRISRVLVDGICEAYGNLGPFRIGGKGT
ncbi:PREDICTED: uncharacterized protein LOC106751431 [Dinoponera quadriceps]|uniref:Uncharacterized protein LOC106751431 n=1 Tax=Dinoponera quadriceps TaxID=609295 RepID=A0A6P3YBN8_DINQU|nr:PREDICTED: uncharacterized protein LOC106751431 [Dinoponera quadriceps]